VTLGVEFLDGLLNLLKTNRKHNMILNPTRILGQTALRYANEMAVVNYERGRRFTFKELHDLTNRGCNMLLEKFKLGEGNIIATLLKNDNMSLLCTLSMKTSCTSLWLGIMESIKEHLYQIDYVKPSLIFIEKSMLEQYHAPLAERNIIMIAMDPPDRPMENVYNFWDLLGESSPADPDVQFVTDDVSKHVWLLKFTGGTTGRGKCAMYSLSNYMSSGTNLSYSEVFPFARPKTLLCTPITHAASAMIIPVYFLGGAIITLNRAEIGLFCRAIEKEKIEAIYTVPTVLYRMIDRGLTKEYDLSSLKTIRYGASPISPAKLEELIARFGSIFVQGYASTEAWVPGTILARNEHDTSTEAGRKRLTSVGRPVPGMEFKIAGDTGDEKPIGVEGEIWIRGPHTITGYYNDPEQTKKGFSEDGFWKSGDIGYMDHDGFVYLVDRKKDMIISGGFNVYATEVENCINAHPAVDQSVVVGIPDDQWGEIVHAEVILKMGAVTSKQDLIDHCKQSISRYKVPKSIEFVEALPLSSVGKLLRREVRKKYRKESKRIAN
jgi:fatty-acyl-CoA synthase